MRLGPGEACGYQDEWGELVEDTSEVALLRVVIDPAIEGDPMELPRHLRRYDDLPAGMRAALAPIDAVAVDQEQTVSFSMNPGRGAAPHFFIDCKQFCEERLDHCMVLGSTEEWTIYNYTPVGHPFHIHVNPFFVTHYFDAQRYDGDGDGELGNAYRPNVPLPPVVPGSSTCAIASSTTPATSSSTATSSDTRTAG